MPENANNIPLDDEDILDLTVVAESGKKSDVPPESGEDFEADLDALLDSLGTGGDMPAPAQSKAQPVPRPAYPAAAKVAAPSARPAPIADQTPVNHVVDPDEKLDMPEMSDIDSLLEELGADVPVQKAAPASAPISEFDSILAQAQAAEASKAKEEAKAYAPTPKPATPNKPQPIADSIETNFPAATDQTRTEPDDAAEDFDSPMGTQGEDIDLNELDALLDDILATAPEMSVPAPSPTAVPEPAPEVLPVPDQAIMPSSEDIAALTDRVQNIEEALEAMESREVSKDIASLADKVRSLEEGLEAMESREVSEPMVNGLIDAKLDEKITAMLEPGSHIMDRILNEIRGMFAEGSFNKDLEKMAAAAAAKVIREEIAALMSSD